MQVSLNSMIVTSAFFARVSLHGWSLGYFNLPSDGLAVVKFPTKSHSDKFRQHDMSLSHSVLVNPIVRSRIYLQVLFSK